MAPITRLARPSVFLFCTAINTSKNQNWCERFGETVVTGAPISVQKVTG